MDFEIIEKDLGGIMYSIGKHESYYKSIQKEYKLNKICYILNWICLVFLVSTFLTIFVKTLYDIVIKNLYNSITFIQLSGTAGISIMYILIFGKIIDDYYYNLDMYYSNMRVLLDDIRVTLINMDKVYNKIFDTGFTLKNYNNLKAMMYTVDLRMNRCLKSIEVKAKTTL